MSSKVIRSRILEIFSVELLIELNYITYMDINNKQKGDEVKNKLKEYGIKFLPLGSGTNRLGLQIEDAVYKIALDKHGMIDNKREFKYTDKLQPYVIKVYECTPDGLVMACEPFSPLSEIEMVESREEMLEILGKISKHFFIGDIGCNKDNYANWGRRKTDKRLGILDFAYIYSVDYNTFRCNQCEARGFLRYDKNYVNLICPHCGAEYTFGQIRRRITKNDEAREIGDITKISYNLTKSLQVVQENRDYTISLYGQIMDEKEKLDEKEARKKRNREIIKKLDKPVSFDEFEPDDPTSFNEIVRMIEEGNL